MSDVTLGIRGEREYRELLALLKDKNQEARPALVAGLCAGAETALVSCLIRDAAVKGAGALIIVQDEKRVRALTESLISFGINAYSYMYRDLVLRNAASSHDFEHERLFVLSRIMEGNFDAVVTTADAALQYTLPPNRLFEASGEIKKDTPIDIDSLTERLTASGYIRADMVDGAGQYSVRGGVVDIFPVSSPNPVRLDLFGDQIDRMVYFDVMTQRSVGECESFAIIPAREVLIDQGSAALIKKVVSAQQKRAKNEDAKAALAEEYDALESGRELYCADKYISLVYPERSCLLDYTEGALCIALDHQSVTRRAEARALTEGTVTASLMEDELLPAGGFTGRTRMVAGIDAEPLYSAPKGQLEEYLYERSSVITSSFGSQAGGLRLSGLFTFRTRQTAVFSGNFDLLLDDIRAYSSGGWRVSVICENETAVQNTVKLLNDSGFGAYDDRERNNNAAPQLPSSFAVLYGAVCDGFELVGSKYAVISLAGSHAAPVRSSYSSKKDRKKSMNLQKIMSYADLDVGDYVVHTIHGIGQYLGLFPLNVGGVRRDFVKIKYAGTDVIYLPCDQLDKISKYIGAHSDDGTLKLSKVGGGEWAKAKSRAKAAAKDMAKELIALYAERKRRPGFRFPADDEMQKEFEEAFAYDETDGQIAAVEDIKADMRRPWPMDRLLCGDVGYGKTEVALRAAFKAAESGKQTAILVPTTILAMQHYSTMISRMRGFPVRIDVISRFKSEAEQQLSLRRLKRGETDIIVGTHRLLSSDVEFHDLGLLIVDEEQRFGVVHKEKLKEIAKNVDVLTLTATPIPRTLNMALSGIRDMSVLEEAPGDRTPVQTYVLEYDELLIADALRRELRRGGQVYYLVNRIDRQNLVAKRIAEMVPEARIECANGRMDRDRLADIWQGMTDGAIDILVSTTIIETGIDLANVNTLVIEDADRLGLSQLHQIRGRVGRSTRRSYAYFTYPRGKLLSEISEKRLAAIRDFTEFGAGFKIALRDMEIRGAGNLLGAEQHGHMNTIGYDLYMKLLNEAVLEEKGEKSQPTPECTVEIAINAYIPETYMKSANQRIDAYKKIALITDASDAADIVNELTDRYGKIPPPVAGLISVSLLRALGAGCGIDRMEYRGECLLIYPREMKLTAWAYLASQEKGKLLVNMSASPYVSLRCPKITEAPGRGSALLEKYREITAPKKSNENVTPGESSGNGGV